VPADELGGLYRLTEFPNVNNMRVATVHCRELSLVVPFEEILVAVQHRRELSVSVIIVERIDLVESPFENVACDRLALAASLHLVT
jgi:hypothetical protein